MYCPECKQGKMAINKKSNYWICEDCGYKLSADEFEDDYVFWFCDECEAYLNNQEGFDRTANTHICRACGYKNETTFNNVKGICSDCGKILSDSDVTLCVDCKNERRKKAILNLAGLATVVVSAIATAKRGKTEGLDFYTGLEDESTESSFKCANCGNTEEESLYDDGETVYCSICCHRTLKSTGKDDLVECPFCHRMRDRTAYYCRYCNDTTWELSSPEEFAEIDEILKDMGL